jgi:hypothetical protein
MEEGKKDATIVTAREKKVVCGVQVKVELKKVMERTKEQEIVILAMVEVIILVRVVEVAI